MIQKVNKLASYATYRQLYNDGKSDTYIVISKFIEHIIISNRIIIFDIEKISKLLNENFGFSIPNYVLQSAIGKIPFVVKENGKFSVKPSKTSKYNSDITKKLEEAHTRSEALTNKLLEYIKDEKKEHSIDKEKLIRDFSSFLLDESFNGEYSDIISKFVVENETDQEFLKNINQIKEGAILFSGLNYTSDISKAAWKNNLNIYVGTEILFHLAGYNGILFQKLANDMFVFIKERNDKDKKRTITIRYFKEVDEEIENFFRTAEEIVRGNKVADIGNVAMETIVEGCSSAVDVIQKRAEFNRLLEDHSIALAQPVDYYSKRYHSFNIESQANIDKYDLSTENKENYLKYLNYINILRARDKVDSLNSNLKESKHIMITEVRKILQMSKDFVSESTEFGIPLAINMYQLTNRLWFDLNKGFGSRQLPAIFNVLDRSRLVLSNILTQKVSQQYDRVIKEYRAGNLTEDDLNENILLLRRDLRRPEEIHKELLKDIDKYTDATNLDMYKSEKDSLKQQLEVLKQEKKIEQCERLKEIQARKDIEKEIENRDITISKISKEREEERKQRIDDILKRKQNVDSKIGCKLRRNKIILILILLAMFATGIYINFKTKNDILVFGITITPGITVILSLALGKKFEYLDMVRKLSNKTKQWYETKLYTEYGIDLEELDKLKTK